MRPHGTVGRGLKSETSNDGNTINGGEHHLIGLPRGSIHFLVMSDFSFLSISIRHLPSCACQAGRTVINVKPVTPFKLNN